MKVQGLLGAMLLFAAAALSGCGAASSAPAAPATSTVTAADPAHDAMCRQTGMESMCAKATPSPPKAPKTLPRIVLEFPQPGPPGNGIVTQPLYAMDANVTSLSIKVWVNATAPASPYALVGPGTPPSDPVLSLKPASGAAKGIVLAGCNGLAGPSASGALKSYTASIDAGVAASYSFSITGSGQNAEVDLQLTENFG